MANNTIQVKRTSTAGRTPNTTVSSNTQYINAGELALNMTDQILYTSDGTNLITVGGNTVNHRVTGTLTVNAISANGSLGTAGQVLTTNSTGVYWSTATGGASANGGGIISQQQFTGDGTTSTFSFTGGYTSNSLVVYLNGVLLRNGTEANVQSGSTFTITPAPANGALIDAIGFSGIYANGTSTVLSQQFTANGTANSFTISGGYIPNQVLVFVNGVKQIPGTDVNIGSGSTINLTTTPANGYVVDVYGAQSTTVSLAANTLTVGNVVIGVNQISVGNSSVNTQIVAGNVFLNGSTLIVGNTAANITVNNSTIAIGTAQVNATNYTGTANNTNFVGTVSAANVVSNSQLSSNLANYQTTAGLASNVATLTANNTSFVGTVSAANVVSNSQLSSNLANYALLSTAAFTGNVSVGGNLSITGQLFVAGNTTVVNATIITTSDLNMVLANGVGTSALANGAGLIIGTYANLVYSSAAAGWQSNVNITPAANNLNIGNTSSVWNVYANNIAGTLTTTSQPNITANNALYLGGVAAASYVQNTDSRVLSGNLNFTGTNTYFTSNITLAAGLKANGSFGTANQVLTSNGTSVYWANSTGGGASVSVSDTAPGTPQANSLWWKSDEGRLYIYYNDGNSSQWVAASPDGAGQYLPSIGGTVSGNVTVTGALSSANLTTTTNTVTIGTAAYHVANGNLGINTSTPAAMIESLSTTSGPGGWFIGGQFTAANYPAIRLAATTPGRISTIGNNGDGGFQFLVNGTSAAIGTAAITVTNTSFVGIGNTTPATPLVVTGTITANAYNANGSVGTNGQVLTSNGSVSYWATPSGGVSTGKSIAMAIVFGG